MAETARSPFSLLHLALWIRRRGGPLLFLLVLVVGYVADLDDQLRRQERAEAEQDHLLAELAAKQRKAAQFDQYKAQLTALREQSGAALREFPDEPDLDDLLRTLIDATIASGLELRRFNPQPPRAYEFYQEQVATVSLSGDYPGLGAFAERLATSAPLSRWRLLDVERLENSRGLSIRGEIATYAYLEPQRPPNGKGNKR